MKQNVKVVTEQSSVPEMPIAKLSIEVVLKNESMLSSPSIVEHEVIQSRHHSCFSNSWLSIEENVNHADEKESAGASHQT